MQTRLLFLEVDPVVMHATGVTAAGRMLSVATDATGTHGNITSILSRLLQSGWLQSTRSDIVFECVYVVTHLDIKESNL